MSHDVSVRELRNHTSEVLRRVEAGERLRVTVDRRPVAELAPLPARDVWVPRERALAAVRGRRLRTLQAAQATYVALPVDAAVASAFAELVATARRTGRRRKVQDAWITATARAHGVAVFAQDSDFDELPVNVVRV